MYITKVPLRVSLIGGGTDLPEFYQKHSGAVVSMAINKYVVVITKRMDPTFVTASRISYKDVTEYIDDLSTIKHDFIRDILHDFKVDFPVEIVTVADIPGGGTGLGSSAATIIGCMAGVDSLGDYTLFGKVPDRMNIAEEAFMLEKKYRHCGKQDHYAVCYGGARHYQFNQDGIVTVGPGINDLCGPLIHRMFLRYTGIASDKTERILSEQSHRQFLGPEMNSITGEFLKGLAKLDYEYCTHCIDASWEIKKEFSPDVTNETIDGMMNAMRAVGAGGMKVLGSGGGGFILGFHENRNMLTLECPGDYLNVSVDYNGLTTWKV